MDKALTQFIAIYEQQSISAASRVTGVTQPTLSENLRKLEQRYKTTLFYRESRGVVATAAAERLYSEAKRIAEHYQAIQQVMEQQVSLLESKVRIGAGEAWWPTVVKPVIEPLIKQQSSLSITYIEGNNKLLAEQLSLGQLDFIIGHELPLLESDLTFTPLFSDTAAYYCAADHVLAREEKVPLATINQFPKVALINSTESSQAIHRNLEHSASSIEVCCDLTKIGDGIFHFIASMESELAERGLQRVKVNTPQHTEVVGVYYHASRLNHLAQKLLTQIINSFNQRV